MENILLYVVIGAIVLAVILGFNNRNNKPGSKSVKRFVLKTKSVPSKASLAKLTKRQIDEAAAAQGIKLDGRETKAKMIDAFIKQSK